MHATDRQIGGEWFSHRARAVRIRLTESPRKEDAHDAAQHVRTATPVSLLRMSLSRKMEEHLAESDDRQNTHGHCWDVR